MLCPEISLVTAMYVQSRRLYYLLLFSLTLLNGCGTEQSGLIRVSGRVSLDGEPVTFGRVQFFPVSGRPSAGSIGTDGTYELTTYTRGDGALPGKYTVTITSCTEVVDGPVFASYEDEMAGNPIDPEWENKSQQATGISRWIVPPRFANRKTSGLSATVGGTEEINFNLDSKP